MCSWQQTRTKAGTRNDTGRIVTQHTLQYRQVDEAANMLVHITRQTDAVGRLHDFLTGHHVSSNSTGIHSNASVMSPFCVSCSRQHIHTYICYSYKGCPLRNSQCGKTS